MKIKTIIKFSEIQNSAKRKIYSTKYKYKY